MRKYGHIPDRYDSRDRHHTFGDADLPSSVSLVDKMPPVYDQESIGSCTGNGTAAAIDYERVRQGLQPMMPSRLFLYNEARVLEGSLSEDAGAQIRDVVKVAAKYGVCSESKFAYDDANLYVHPGDSIKADAVMHLATGYKRLDHTELDSLRGALASGYPIIAGISVYSSFESLDVAKSGVVPMPSPGEDLLGGHCILIVGYDNTSQQFTCRNSWGIGWGQEGYFTIPYPYITDNTLASDFWIITLESNV